VKELSLYHHENSPGLAFEVLDNYNPFINQFCFIYIRMQSVIDLEICKLSKKENLKCLDDSFFNLFI